MRILCFFILMLSVSCQKTHQNFRYPNDTDIAENIKNRKMIVVGLLRNYLPYSFSETKDEFIGFDIDILQAIADDLDCKITYKIITSEDVNKSLNAYEIDFVMGAIPTPNTERGLDYSISYNNFESTFLVLNKSDLYNAEDCASKKIGYINGGSQISSTEVVTTSPLFFHSPNSALEALKKGDINAIKGDSVLIHALKRTSNNYRVIDTDKKATNIAFAFKENQSNLRDMLNNSLMKIWENGTWQDTFETWFSEGSLYSSDSNFRINVIPR